MVIYQVHDLKTPIHSMNAETDYLRQYIIKFASNAAVVLSQLLKSGTTTINNSNDTTMINKLSNDIIIESSSEVSSSFINSFTTFVAEASIILDHLDGMSQLLLMNINRGQDFVKSSSGIP